MIHVLGADIPHHNHTLLRFFAEVLSTYLPSEKRFHFMVVTQDPSCLPQWDSVVVECYANKNALAQAVCQRARQQRGQRFFFHGQFNPYIWLALLTGRLKSTQCWWHIWGADLYEASDDWRHRLFYRLRRVAQRKVGHVVGTQGDLHYFSQRCPKVPTSLLYFPTNMQAIDTEITPTKQLNEQFEQFTILLGNSGDRSNRHLEGLQQIVQQWGTSVHLILPFSYPVNNSEYLAEMRRKAMALLPLDSIEYLTESLALDDYLTVLRRCQLAYFLFQRQQGIGTLCLLIQHNIPVVLSRHNPFCQDLLQQGIPFLWEDEPLDRVLVQQTQQQLVKLDKRQIAFFSPNYISGWKALLSRSAGEPV